MSDKKNSAVGDLAEKIGLAAISNMIGSTITNPCDIIKVRQQIHESKLGIVSEARQMVANEGFFSLYKGLSASMLRESTYSGIRWGAYDACKAVILEYLHADPNGLLAKLGAGMASGMIGAAISNPADLLKVRMQAQGATGTLRDHARGVWQEKGLAGMYRAVLPTTIRAGVVTASQIGVYDYSKYTLLHSFPQYFAEDFKTHFTASAIAGFACSVTSNPIDVVKVRMMAGSKYPNMFNCVFSIVKNEGPMALYKGFTMCFLRLWPHSVISLLIFEELRRMMGHKPI